MADNVASPSFHQPLNERRKTEFSTEGTGARGILPALSGILPDRGTMRSG